MNDQSILLPNIRGKYNFYVPLSKFCWFKVGGTADVIFTPKDLNDLIYFLRNKPKNLPILVIGAGSNLLIRDGGFSGIIIRLGKFFNSLKIIEQDIIEAGAMTLCSSLALYSAENALSGLEFMSGIPGTVGGAIAMNAGAYGSDTSTTLINITLLTLNGEIVQIPTSSMQYTYRGNNLGYDAIFVNAKFQAKKCECSHYVFDKIAAIKNTRSNTQPIHSKTAGSAFKNTKEGYNAWKLIDKAGCRGMKIGGAMISNQHCNFLINEGNATADDIENLLQSVQRKVLDSTNILLEPEIKIFGQKKQIKQKKYELMSQKIQNIL
ncbi:MAG: UDP-N-acetylmuramate dehydrogenase [Proteobacteria bacterium]|nr:UDP-N-acetylmuramate dehydrogenase [Pseudomonadota bacterium]